MEGLRLKKRKEKIIKALSFFFINYIYSRIDQTIIRYPHSGSAINYISQRKKIAS